MNSLGQTKRAPSSETHLACKINTRKWTLYIHSLNKTVDSDANSNINANSTQLRSQEGKSMDNRQIDQSHLLKKIFNVVGVSR